MYIVGSHEKVFEWLVANEFLSNSKNISPLYLQFLHFLHNLFFLPIKFSTPHHGKIHSIKFSRNGHQNMFLSIYCRNIKVRTLVYEAVLHEFLKTFLRIFVRFVKEDVCEIVLIISTSTDYEFSTVIYIFKVLIWSVYYYHEMLADTDRREKYKRLVAYRFHAWQINWYLTPRTEKLLMKNSIASRLRPICFWFSFDPSSNSWLNVIFSPIKDLS